jgi:hypothetical protein
MLIGRRFAVFAVSLFKEEPGKGDLGIAFGALSQAIVAICLLQGLWRVY